MRALGKEQVSEKGLDSEYLTAKRIQLRRLILIRLGRMRLLNRVDSAMLTKYSIQCLGACALRAGYSVGQR